MGFNLVWADQPREAPWEGEYHFRANGTAMALIREELEAQGAGEYTDGVANVAINLEKLDGGVGNWVSDAECAAIVRVASREPKIGLEHEDIGNDEDLASWRDLWQRFLDYVGSAADHRGFFVH